MAVDRSGYGAEAAADDEATASDKLKLLQEGYDCAGTLQRAML